MMLVTVTLLHYEEGTPQKRARHILQGINVVLILAYVPAIEIKQMQR